MLTAARNDSSDQQHSRLVEIAKDWRYAKLSTWMQGLTTLCSWLNPNNANRSFEIENPNTSAKANFISKAQDLFLRLRMMGQMSLHADPGNQKLAGDDIANCNLHNITAQQFGMKSYKYHAFWSLPSWALQFVFTGKHALGVIPNTFLRMFDRTMRLVTNMFWNVRRITLGVVPYVNGDLITGPNSEAYKKLREVSTPIRTLMSLSTIKMRAWLYTKLNKVLPRPLMKFVEDKFSFISVQQIRADNDKFTEEHEGQTTDVAELLKTAVANYKNNVNALKTGQHKSIITGEVQDLEIEEPNTPAWYRKLKLCASFLNPWIGVGSLGLNTASMGIGLFGELVRKQSIKPLSLAQNLGDMANGAMSLVYLLGEVAGHAAKFQQHYRNGEVKYENLLTCGIGTLGMGWRVFKSLFAGLAIPGMLIKPLGDFCNKVLHSKLDNILDPLFLLFFSVNRHISLKNSYKIEESTAAYHERKTADEEKSVGTVLGLIPRILMRDPKVTYDNPEAIAKAQLLAT